MDEDAISFREKREKAQIVIEKDALLFPDKYSDEQISELISIIAQREVAHASAVSVHDVMALKSYLDATSAKFNQTTSDLAVAQSSVILAIALSKYFQNPALAVETVKRFDVGEMPLVQSKVWDTPSQGYKLPQFIRYQDREFSLGNSETLKIACCLVALPQNEAMRHRTCEVMERFIHQNQQTSPSEGRRFLGDGSIGEAKDISGKIRNG